MQRRTIIKNFVYLAGGLALLPSCLHHEQGASIPLKNLRLDADGEKTLGEVAGTIIPTTDTPGAKDLGVHQFAMIMLDDCYDQKAQNDFTQGLRQLNDLAQKQYHTAFANATTAQKEALLNDIEHKKYEGPVNDFYHTAKRLTVQGYLNSKYYMTNINKYELVPGRFKGCVSVTLKQA